MRRVQFWLQRFRVLFPSWRFFENIRPAPRLEFRIRRSDQSWGPWLTLAPHISPTRGLFRLFHNPQENLELAFQAQVEDLLGVIVNTPSNHLDRIQRSVPYLMVEQLIRNQLWTYPGGLAPLSTFQFRLGVFEIPSITVQTSVFDSTPHPSYTEILHSPELEL